MKSFVKRQHYSNTAGSRHGRSGGGGGTQAATNGGGAHHVSPHVSHAIAEEGEQR